VTYSSTASTLVDGDTNGVQDIFVFDRQTATTGRVSVSSGGQQGNDHSGSPSISADGSHVTYFSYASTLVGGDTNGAPDVFVAPTEFFLV
jgi:Tol biopolymer transport system component